jgi:uncharacterized protein YbaR (Trm112 family)
LQVGFWDYWSLEIEACPDCEDRFHVQVFAPLKVLHEAEAIGVLICPRSRIAGTVFEGTDRLVPFQIVGWVFAFEIIAAWESKERLES